jgi:hypothetical protein
LYVVPLDGRIATIIIKDKLSEIEVFHQKYRLINIPKPILHFGGISDGVIPNNSTLITLKPHDYIFFPIEYFVNSYTIYDDHDTIYGSGDEIEKNSMVQLIENKNPITIHVEYSTSLGSIGDVTQTFLPNLNIQTAEPFQGKFIVLDSADFFYDLLNPKNELSFLNLVLRNSIDDPIFLSIPELKRLEQSSNSNKLTYYYGNSLNLPIKKQNGLDSLNADGLRILSANQKWGIDLTDISKLVLFVEDKNGRNAITRIGFAKRYYNESKYDLTGLIHFGDSKLFYPKFVYSNPILDTLINNPTILNHLKEFQLNYYEELDFESALKQPRFIDYTSNTLALPSIDGLTIKNYSLLIEESFPFELSWIDKHINHKIDSVFHLLDIGGIPLINRYGEDSIDVSGNRVYPIYSEFIYWKNTTALTPFIEWELDIDSDDKRKMDVNRIIYCVQSNNDYIPIFYVDFTNGLDMLDPNTPLYQWMINVKEKYTRYYDQMEWERIFSKQLTNPQNILNPKRKRDMKQLRKTFHLNELNGVPTSLLGVY